jgi:hypothetical protein
LRDAGAQVAPQRRVAADAEVKLRVELARVRRQCVEDEVTDRLERVFAVGRAARVCARASFIASWLLKRMSSLLGKYAKIVRVETSAASAMSGRVVAL